MTNITLTLTEAELRLLDECLEKVRMGTTDKLSREERNENFALSHKLFKAYQEAKNQENK